MLTAVLSEYIGTFIFLSIILIVGEPLAIAVGLLAVIYAFGSISGGHMNPAVSTMMFAKGDIDLQTYVLYVIAQVLGGLTALYWWMLNNKDKNK